jgi:hypothetical protein
MRATASKTRRTVWHGRRVNMVRINDSIVEGNLLD